MSVLMDYMQMKNGLVSECHQKLPDAFFASVSSEAELAAASSKVGKSLWRRARVFGSLLAETFRIDPFSENRSARKTPYDYIHVRGLY